jgi:general nucleoside transport system permease protein
MSQPAGAAGEPCPRPLSRGERLWYGRPRIPWVVRRVRILATSQQGVSSVRASSGGLLAAVGAVGYGLLVPLLAIVTAVAIGALVIWLTGAAPPPPEVADWPPPLLQSGLWRPVLAYIGLAQGAAGSPEAVSETLVWATPYIFAGLAVALAFKGGLFNIGAEGQLALGALLAAWAGVALPGIVGPLPGIVHVPLALAIGALAGAAWGALPGWLKARTGAHEVINTIMLNYLALLLSGYLLNGPWKDPGPFNVIAQTALIADSAQLAPLLAPYRLHWGLPLALVMAVLVHVLLTRTTLGFEIKTVGTNPSAARYAGMRVGRTLVLTMGLSGLLAGLAGAVEVVALNYRHTLSFNIGYGFDAITVALLGKTHPAGVVAAALLFGALRAGATRMQFLTQVPVDIISVIQALILLFVAADAIVRRLYRLRPDGSRPVLTRGWGG